MGIFDGLLVIDRVGATDRVRIGAFEGIFDKVGSNIFRREGSKLGANDDVSDDARDGDMVGVFERLFVGLELEVIVGVFERLFVGLELEVIVGVFESFFVGSELEVMVGSSERLFVGLKLELTDGVGEDLMVGVDERAFEEHNESCQGQDISMIQS